MEPEIGKIYAVWQGDGTLWKIEVEDVIHPETGINLLETKKGDRVLPGIYCKATVVMAGSVNTEKGVKKPWVINFGSKFEYEWSDVLEVLYG